MSKGIVVMNKPDRCIECPMSYHADDLELCGGCYKRLYRCRLEPEDVEEVYIDLHTKPDWCPIIPFTKEMQEWLLKTCDEALERINEKVDR